MFSINKKNEYLFYETLKNKIELELSDLTVFIEESINQKIDEDEESESIPIKISPSPEEIESQYKNAHGFKYLLSKLRVFHFILFALGAIGAVLTAVFAPPLFIVFGAALAAYGLTSFVAGAKFRWDINQLKKNEIDNENNSTTSNPLGKLGKGDSPNSPQIFQDNSHEFQFDNLFKNNHQDENAKQNNMEKNTQSQLKLNI